MKTFPLNRRAPPHAPLFNRMSNAPETRLHCATCLSIHDPKRKQEISGAATANEPKFPNKTYKRFTVKLGLYVCVCFCNVVITFGRSYPCPKWTHVEWIWYILGGHIHKAAQEVRVLRYRSMAGMHCLIAQILPSVALGSSSYSWCVTRLFCGNGWVRYSCEGNWCARDRHLHFDKDLKAVKPHNVLWLAYFA